MEPQAYCDGIAEKFKETWQRVGISNDDFIRTTEPRHETRSPRCGSGWKRPATSTRPEYDGMYCVGCETAKSEDDVDLENGQKVCKIHRTPVESVKEKNYFFRLSKYAPRLLEWYAQRPRRCNPSRAETRCAPSSRADCAIYRCRG
jgi:methionyl-tRNA synthetase